MSSGLFVWWLMGIRSVADFSNPTL